jgi:hypothetical protein
MVLCDVCIIACQNSFFYMDEESDEDSLPPPVSIFIAALACALENMDKKDGIQDQVKASQIWLLLK